MTPEDKIKIAEQCGLTFTGEYLDKDNPEFVGTDENWEAFSEVLDRELFFESNRMISGDKVFGEE